jgi:hypothetical protein
MKIELLGRLGEQAGTVDVPEPSPEVVAVHARYFVLDRTKFYDGAKYVECNFERIERRAEGARGTAENRKAAGA